jgi:phosphoglycolate phosphatase
VLIEVEMETVADALPYPGVSEALQQLAAAGYRIGIVTRNCQECVQHFLVRYPLRNDVCLTRDDVALVKPDPSHLLAALAQLRVGPEAAVMVGDHRSDIECALGAGCRSVGVLLTGTTGEQFGELGADAVFPDVPAFVAALCDER